VILKKLNQTPKDQPMKTYEAHPPISTREHVEAIVAANAAGAAAAPLERAAELLDQAAPELDRLADKLPAEPQS
jgi:hypothetical protein